MKNKSLRRALGWAIAIASLPVSLYLFGFVVLYLRNRPPAPRPLPSTPARFPFEELAALDHVVQVRFAVVPDKDFGAARIGPRHEYFRPLSTEEKHAVEGLQKVRKTVVFYVVGRNFLPNVRGVTYPTTVQGPIYFTPGAKVSVSATRDNPYALHSTRFLTRPLPRRDLPPEEELIQAALPVFERADTQNGATSQLGKWQVTSVPVRATNEACVSCHNGVPVSRPRDDSARGNLLNPRNADKVALNQPLGIAMYCVQDAKELKPAPSTRR